MAAPPRADRVRIDGGSTKSRLLLGRRSEDSTVLTVWSLGIDLEHSGDAVLRVCCSRAWLFDIVKRVFDVFASSRGGTVRVREHAFAVPGLDGVKRVLIAEFVRHDFWIRQTLPAPCNGWGPT